MKVEPKTAAVVALVAMTISAFTVGVVATVTLSAVVLSLGGWRTWWVRLGAGRLRRELVGSGWATKVDVLRDLRPRGRTTRLGRTAIGTRVPMGVRVKVEQVVAILGGPRTGKTLSMISIVRRHVGPVIASSARFDLLLRTISARARGKGPVWVFAPAGVHGATGTLLRHMAGAGWVRWMQWDVLDGCTDPQVANQRAAAMVDAIDVGSKEDSTWLDSAATVLKSLLRAAAFGGVCDVCGGCFARNDADRLAEHVRLVAAPGQTEPEPEPCPGSGRAAARRTSMADVYRWITSPTEMGEAGEILALFDMAAVRELMSEVLSANEKGAASVLRSARLATAFMALPGAAWACCPPDHAPALDVADLLANSGSLYIVGSERNRDGMSPLMAALTQHCWDTAVEVAKEEPSEKLTDTLLLNLDELIVSGMAAGLADKAAVAGGYNIHLVWSCQNLAQLRAKIGRDATDSLLDVSTTKLVFGGIETPEDVARFAPRCGEVDGQPILPAHKLTDLPKFRALLLAPECMRKTIVATPRAFVRLPEAAQAALPALPWLAVAKVRQLASTRPVAELEPVRVPAALPPARGQFVNALVDREAA